MSLASVAVTVASAVIRTSDRLLVASMNLTGAEGREPLYLGTAKGIRWCFSTPLGGTAGSADRRGPYAMDQHPSAACTCDLV
jgi:hypothetical protein